MGQYKDVPYPLRICVELMHYNAMSNPKTQEFRPSDLKEHLLIFFTEEQILESLNILTSEGLSTR